MENLNVLSKMRKKNIDFESMVNVSSIFYRKNGQGEKA